VEVSQIGMKSCTLFRIKQSTMDAFTLTAEALNVMQSQQVTYYIIQNYTIDIDVG
jgi:hypothetical protein